MTKPKTILVIDDDDSLRRLAEYNLREDGYEVLAPSQRAAAVPGERR